jgi:hypothetical protein
MTRTLSVTLTHNSGFGGETFGLGTTSATNFGSPTPNPANWTQAVGAQQTVLITGTLAKCSSFNYTFDVTGADRLGVFVTSSTSTGSLGGATGADTTCQNLANTAKLGGTWKAWISDSSTTSPSVRFNNPTGKEYMMPNGTVVANNFADLTDGTLASGINRDENGNSVGTVSVWTATQKTGILATGSASSVTCSGFTSNLATRRAVAGSTGKTTQAWTFFNTPACSSNARLMCFEQDP